MRRMVWSSLILLPALAHAQTGTPAASPASLRAELARPVAPASATPARAVVTPTFHETVKTTMVDDLAFRASRHPGTLEYAMMGDLPTQVSAPRVTRAVELQLSDGELQSAPEVTSVVVRGTVDQNGVPRNLSVARSAGDLVDKRALAAVSQYRFLPATRDNQPVDAPVVISITIHK